MWALKPERSPKQPRLRLLLPGRDGGDTDRPRDAGEGTCDPGQSRGGVTGIGRARSSPPRSVSRWTAGPGRQPATKTDGNRGTRQQLQQAGGDTSTAAPPVPHLEASLSLLDVLLGVENDDVDLGHVEHPQRDKSAEGHGNGQSGRLDEHLWTHKDTTRVRRQPRKSSDVPPSSPSWCPLARPLPHRQ